MAKPIIGVTPLWDEEKKSLWMLPDYLDGVARAGGMPVVLPFTDDRGDVQRLAESLDGFLFTGGQDIDPGLYREVKLPQCGEVSPERDRLEALLFETAVQVLGKPAFGICRGHQMLNVMLGGTLYQDLATQAGPVVEHRQQPPYSEPQHQVTILPQTPLHDLLGKDSLAVNSLHHQAVKDLAPELKAAATSPEGYVEALYRPGHRFLLAVQWHPEYCLGEAASDALFSAFVEACR